MLLGSNTLTHGKYGQQQQQQKQQQHNNCVATQTCRSLCS
jgi:hypothetical protein